ncbi:MAG: extracellular solute-binding protein [Treponema sp.]|jgi:ABC-type glycerol-3-phosphate transport system substrate-binding protein|nr:extracellular solute-binding protein [Treponema sp.]
MKMTQKKRFPFAYCCTALVAAAALFTLAACNRGESKASASGEKGPVTITFRTWNPNDEAFAVVQEAWKAKNTNINVELVQSEYSDHIQSLKVNVASGEGPDIYGIQVGAIMNEFQEFTLDVASKAAETWGSDWESKFVPEYMAQVKGGLDGYYGLPLGGLTSGYIWANMEYFNKYNLEIPTNYNEMLEVCKIFRANGELPVLLGAKDDWINLDTFITIAADINTEKFFDALEGKAPFTDPDIVQALEIWKNIFTDGIVQDGALGVNVYMDTHNMFTEEYAAPMMFNGSWNTNVDFGTGKSFEVFTIDWNMDGRQAPVLPAVDVVVSINKEGKYPDETWQFYSWLVDEGAQLMIDQRLQYMPVKANARINTANFSKNQIENLDTIVEIANDRARGYREITYPRLKQVIADQLKAVAIGESTPQAAAGIMEEASKSERR